MMKALRLSGAEAPVQRLLAIGAHSDDIEIGCGGTILALTRAVPDLAVDWVVLAAGNERETEARVSAAAFLAQAGSVHVDVHAFRDGFLPYTGAAVKEVFEDMKARADPQLVFTHARHDLHQDHRLVAELTWNTFRNHLVLEYEIPKFDGDLGSPNVFVPLDDAIVTEKINLLREHFSTQRDKHWFDEELFRGLHRIRATEAGGGTRYAEAFVCRKLLLGI